MKISKNRAQKFGADETKKVWKRSKGRCSYCGIQLVLGKPDNLVTEKSFTIDHILPVSKGGTNNVSNIRAACSKCNNIRGNASLYYLRYKLVAQDCDGPEFSEDQFEYLLDHGMDLYRMIGKYIFYYEYLEVR